VVVPIASDELMAKPRPIYLSSIILSQPYAACTQVEKRRCKYKEVERFETDHVPTDVDEG